MIIESYHDHPLRRDPVSQAKMYASMVYPLSDTIINHVHKVLLPGKNVGLFSGSWRLNLDSTYIEMKKFRHCDLNFHANTIFVDHFNFTIFDYVLHRLRPKNLLILHNDWWTAHQPILELIERVDTYLKYTRKNDGQIIFTLPLVHLNFNKLTTNLDSLLASTNATVVEDSGIWVRR